MPTETRTPHTALAGGELSDALRANLLQLVYSQFGERMAEMVSRSLGNASITARDVEAILRAAEKMSAARKTAFTSAKLTLENFVWADRGRARAPDSRHPALLAYCVKVVGGNARTGDRLHDRVQSFLEKRGQWPILNAHEFMTRAKPTVLLLAAWNSDEAN